MSASTQHYELLGTTAADPGHVQRRSLRRALAAPRIVQCPGSDPVKLQRIAAGNLTKSSVRTTDARCVPSYPYRGFQGLQEQLALGEVHLMLQAKI